MNSGIRIPTILGLGVLAAGLIVGVFLMTNNKFLSFRTQASPATEPKNVTIANVSDTSASIYWQTDDPAPGFIHTGTGPSLDITVKDERDLDNPSNRLFHFVTLNKLTPNTTYFYRIISGAMVYPQGEPLSFTTSSPQEILSLTPIIGAVLDENQQPIAEAIVTLDIPGAQNLATVTKTAGNFILPLSRILTQDLTASLILPESSINATLTVFNNEKSSRVTLQLPLQEQTLPVLILGQNIDFTPEAVSPTTSFSIYDLNKDGVVNSLDLATLRSTTGKDLKLEDADFNRDGVIDQKDADILSKFIPNTSPK